MTTFHEVSRPMAGIRTALIVPSLLVAAFASTATAQINDVAAASSKAPIVFTPATRGDREAEYAALARDVETYDRELGLVKLVGKLVTPAVDHIESKPLPRYEGRLQIEEAGSGVIVQLGSSTYVLTNRHVIRHSSPERIDIHLADGRVFHPTRIWSDSETDVAVMAIESAPGLAAAKLGDSDALEIGDFVLAIGSPFGL